MKQQPKAQDEMIKKFFMLFSGFFKKLNTNTAQPEQAVFELAKGIVGFIADMFVGFFSQFFGNKDKAITKQVAQLKEDIVGAFEKLITIDNPIEAPNPVAAPIFTPANTAAQQAPQRQQAQQATAAASSGHHRRNSL